ncbi:unnamed protein product, partial [Brassica oleracea var. botrytis]
RRHCVSCSENSAVTPHVPFFICFSKPSPHIYTSGSLKLENTPPQVSFSTTTVVEANDDHYVDGLLDEEKQEEEQGQCHGEILKSSLRKKALDGRMERKQVQWVDVMGKELAEIREFELKKMISDMMVIKAVLASFCDQSTFASRRLHVDSRYNMAVFCYAFRIAKRVVSLTS